jgi:hypothetical protein
MKDRPKDRSMYRATKAPSLIAAALIFAAGAGLARADEPTHPAEESVEPASAPVETVPLPATIAPAQPAATPAPPAPVPAPAQTAPVSWFARPPLALVVGEGARQFKLTLYGFVEADYIYDTTRSYNDAMGSSLVARKDTYDGNNSRSQFSMRNSRLGFAFESPTVGGVKPTAVLEADFFGHQDAPHQDPTTTTSENTYFDSPTYRVRHAYVKLANPYVDVLLGQTYDLFGWQNFSFPCSLEFLGLPNQLFSRNPQLRLSHGFGADGAVGVDIAISAGRPAQRDSQIPDGSAGVRLILNHWRGITTPGNVGTTSAPASIGISGIVRQFNVNAFAPPPTRNSNSTMGWGMSVDALLPVIPAASEGDRSNRLTLTGSFVRGTGIADLITSGGGAQFAKLQNSQQANPAPLYDVNIDNSLVAFDADGVVHTLNWTAFRVGLQYYLPPTGRILFSANYTQSHSDNLSKFYYPGGSELELLSTTADTSRYVDANLFWDVTPALRLGISGQYTQVEYMDHNKPHNIRGMGQSVYVF